MVSSVENIVDFTIEQSQSDKFDFDAQIPLII